jgi:phage terminase large subunit GpA-like protein
MNAAALYAEALFKGLQPDSDLSLAEWSNKFRVLSQKGAAEAGPYRIERTPFLREIADCLSVKSPIQRVVFMKSSQIGGSELGFNWLGYIIHMVPGPVMMVQPSLDLAEKVSKQRIASMIEETAPLREIMSTAAREKENKILLKEFRGGFLVMAGANSATALRSMPIKYLFLDEVSAYPADCGEGDPVALAEKRTQTFGIRKKIFLNSTPLIKESCRIEAEYLNSDQRKYYVPCPHCGAMQSLKFRQIKFDHEDPKTTRYECEHCQKAIKEHQKTEMLKLGEWRQEAPENAHTAAGFHISALYSPVGWTSWEDIVTEFLKVRKDAPALKQFTNAILGETWEENGQLEKLGWENLKSRAEDYGLGFAPEGVVAITAGVDIQDNRVAVVVYGWGADEECWVLDHQEILGSPATPEVWKQLENLLDQSFEHETHAPLKVQSVAIDSGGHFTHEVYQFTRHNRNRGRDWFAVKGSSTKGQPAIGKPRKVDINIKGQSLKGGAILHMVGTDTIKALIYGRLKHNEPGQGFMHFSDELTDDFYQQLTSEKQVTRYVRGFPVKDWALKKGHRNECLDCSVYAYAALQKLLSRYNRNTVWVQLQNKLVPKGQIASNKTQNTTIKGDQPPIKPKRGGFVQGW